MATFRARGLVAFGRRFFGTLDQAAVGGNVLDTGETCDGMDLIPHEEAEEFADPRHRLAQVDGLGLVLLSRVDEVSLQVAEELIRVVDQRQVDFQAFLDRKVGKPRSDARAVWLCRSAFSRSRAGCTGYWYAGRGPAVRPVSG
jgi:hypothetical protein